MRKLALAVGVSAAALLATPVFACSMMNQAATSTPRPTAGASPMMCGSPTTVQAQPQTAQPAQPAASGCSCCRSMAMMQPQPGQPGGMGAMPGMEMPGMQGSPTPPPTSSPESPKPN